MENRLLIININEMHGSHTVTWTENGVERAVEVYSFKNGENAFCGHKIWDIDSIYAHIREGIKVAYSIYPDLAGIKINTWNYDYVLMNNDMELLPCYSYRDSRINELDEFEIGHTTYSGTMPQIIVDMRHGRLRTVTDILMMSEYFVYKLTGVKVSRYRKCNSRNASLYLRPELRTEIGAGCKVLVG